jgi:hypothetical protein
MLFGVAIPTRLDQSLGTIAVYSARFQRPAPNGIPLGQRSESYEG